MQGSDVLFGFRKACHVWIAMNQCNDSTSDSSSTKRLEPPHSEAGPSKPSNDNIYDNRNHLYYSEQDMCDRLYSSTSDLSLERRTSSILPLSLSSSAQTLNERIVSVPSVSVSTEMRKVSFAPTLSVISTGMSEERPPQKAPPTKSLCSRFLSNLASLTNYKTRRIQRQSQGYPRLCPRDYPPPPPPCTASHPHMSKESQAHMSHTGSSQGMSDNMLELLFKGTSSTLEQHANDHIPLGSANHPMESISRGCSLTNVRGTCSLDVSLFTTLSIDSLNRIERCSSAPSFLVQWYGAMSTAVKTVESESFDHLQLLSAIDSNTSGTVLESGASNDIVSIHNSIEDLFPNASSTTHSTSTSRSDTGLDCTDSCSLHRSIHQLASPSNSASVSTNSSSETSQLTSASISCLDCDISSEGDLLHRPLSESPLDSSDAMSIISSSNSTDFGQLSFASASYSTSEVSTESEHTHFSILNNESERMHLSLLQFTSTISSCSELDHLTPYSRSSIDADTSTESNAIHLPLSDSLLDTSDATEIETDQLVSDSSSSMDSGESIQIYPSLPDNTDANAITAIPSSSVTDVEHTLADENGPTECAASFSNNRAVELVQGKNEVVPVCEVAEICLSLDQPSTSDHGRSLSAKSASNDSNNIESSFISLRDVSCAHNVDASLIDVPSLISTLKHVASLLSSSHAMLDLSLSTLQEKLRSQPSIPSNYCVCVRNGRCHRDVDLNRSNSKIVAASKSEPLLHPV